MVCFFPSFTSSLKTISPLPHSPTTLHPFLHSSYLEYQEESSPFITSPHSPESPGTGEAGKEGLKIKIKIQSNPLTPPPRVGLLPFEPLLELRDSLRNCIYIYFLSSLTSLHFTHFPFITVYVFSVLPCLYLLFSPSSKALCKDI